MENLLTFYKSTRTLIIRCPICGQQNRFTLPDRDKAPLELLGRRCNHLELTADAQVCKIDMPNIAIQEI